MRSNIQKRFAVWFCFLIFLAAQVHAAQFTPPDMTKFKAVPPFPSLVTAAQERHIPLDRIDLPTNADTLNPGDSITALVTQNESKNRRSQWLIYLQVVSPDAAEIKTNAPKPMVIYTSFGGKHEFASSSAVVTVRTLGPFVEPDAHGSPPMVQDKTTRFTLDKGFLSLGFDDAAAAYYRLGKFSKKTNISDNFGFSDKPFSAKAIEEGRKEAEKYHITDKDERAMIGIIPAIISYIQIVQQTRSLSQIMYKVAELPSIWSLLKNGMKDSSIDLALQGEGIAPMDSAALGMTNAVFRLPIGITINGQPVLELTLIVTAPRPPLLACGGIIGFLAENPVRKDNYLTFRVISARRTTGHPDKIEEPTPLLPVVADAKPPWGRVVMIGASVTAGFTLSEPFGGDKTAQYDLSRYLDAALLMPHERVRNFGDAGFYLQPESAAKLQIDQARKAKPTLVSAIDFLFWFCYGEQSNDAERLQRFENGLKMLEPIHCPLILGDIPDASATSGILTRDQIPSAKVMAAANRRLKEWAATRPHVVVVPLSDFMRAAATDSALTIRNYSLAKGRTGALLQQDKLHPSVRGCSVLTLAILDACQSEQIGASTSQLCLNPEEILSRTKKPSRNGAE